MSVIRRLNHLIIQLSDYPQKLAGWRRNVTAFLLGVLATLTLAPFYLFLLLIPAFGGLLLLLDGASTPRRAFLDGWWWGWGFYMSGLYWFCIALLTEPEKFAWLIPFALLGLTGVIAIYSGVACWLTAWTKTRGLTRIIVFSTIWTVVEYARGHLFTGFPWNLPGYVFGFSDATLQLASLVGAYGLTFFAVLLGASFAGISKKRGVIVVAAVWSIFIIGAIWGKLRLPEPYIVNNAEGVRLRLVQAAIQQHHKWDPRLRMQGLQEHVRLTQSPGLENVTHVIWPETAVPYTLRPDTPLARMLGSAVPEDTMLITGTLRAEGEGLSIWNSLAALDHQGNIVGSYDKVKLVPFGEFLPFRALIPASWLTPVGDTDFSSGPQAQTFQWPSLPPMMPLICYEAIFPEWGLDASPRPQWLLNLTNDAWFGISSGPYQHFAMARMRAAEQGVPLVRVANTGITAVVDGYGRVVASLGLGEQGVLDSSLPQARREETTYARYNNRFLQLLIIFSLLLAVWQRIRQKN